MTVHKKKTVLSVILMLMLHAPVKGIGGMGAYYIEGYALTTTGDTLKHANIMVGRRGSRDTVRTDGTGYFKVRIQWYTLCPTGTILKRLRDNIQNQATVFMYNKKKVKVKNYYREAENDTVYRRNLVFRIRY